MSEETKKVSAKASEEAEKKPARVRAAQKNEAVVEAAPVISEVPAVEEAAAEEKRPFRKTRVGVVVSDKMDKTIVVAVVDHVRHPLYKKIVKRTSRLKAHDEKNECKVGDSVRVMETRPYSREKRWRLTEIIRKAK